MAKRKTRVELNLRGLNELMKSPEIQAHLQKAGEKVASAAGEGYGARTHTASFVAITNVYPETAEAARRNYAENRLLKGIGAAGLPTTKPR